LRFADRAYRKPRTSRATRYNTAGEESFGRTNERCNESDGEVHLLPC